MTNTSLLSARFNLDDDTRAIFIANYPSGSPEWHELRATGIGGSEIGTILGLNKWESPYTLWAKKSGLIADSFEPNEAMEWGTRLEPVILDKFETEHPELTLLRDVGTWRHPDREWQLANPDALYVEDGNPGIVEVKTAQYEDDWVDGPPKHYEAQVQWYLDVFGFDRAKVVALFHGNRYREYDVKASALWAEAAIERAEQFIECLATQTGPEFDGALSTYTTVRALHPEIDDTEVELGELGQSLLDYQQLLKNAEQNEMEIRSRVLSQMGNSKRGLVDGVWRFTRQARGTGTPYLINKRG